eukprot:GHVS01050297.1.p1 GENE.GHVS01050297.1~~GHVS01050297.1.p1  ORF type:complete len:795 (+),score=93.79 GHVS01050297.1:108-2492(+)
MVSLTHHKMRCDGGGRSSSSRVSTYRGIEPWNVEEAQTNWMALSEAIQQIYTANASELSFEELYRRAYNLTLYKYGDMLYQGVERSMEAHLIGVSSEILATRSDEELLEKLVQKWEEHVCECKLIRDILMYMDNNYVQQKNLLLIYDLGLKYFLEVVLFHRELGQRLTAALLSNLARDREVDRSAAQVGEVKKVTQLLVAVTRSGGGLAEKHSSTSAQLWSQSGMLVCPYRVLLERPALHQAQAHYRSLAQHSMDSMSVPAYLTMAREALDNEERRVSAFLHSQTGPRLHSVVKTELITNHASELIAGRPERGGAKQMFDQADVFNMRRMYQLFEGLSEPLASLMQVMRSCIVQSGEEILGDVSKAREPLEFVESLLELKRRYDLFLRCSFNEDKEFQAAIKSGFEHFLNVDTRAAQYLSLYLDELFKKNIKELTDSEVETRLDLVISLFRFLQDKDVFETIYKQHLGRRLLSNRSLSLEAEKSMVARLKTECGQSYTAKLDGMFKDVRLSEETMKDYQDKSNSRGSAPRSDGGQIQLQLKVLQTGNWPSDCSAITCEIPRSLSHEISLFEAFYFERHQCRRLTWLYDKGTAEVRSTFPSGRYELTMTTYQMIMLDLFNTYASISYETIQAQTRIPAEELKRHLIGFYASPRVRVLTRHCIPDDKPTRELRDTDIFKVNDEFASRIFKVRVPTVAAGSKGLEPSAALTDVSQIVPAVPHTVEQDRQHLVEANIVRIMKARKRLSHTDLVMEVINGLQSRFLPAPTLIKQRIEKLIEREYLERDSTDMRIYSYLA